MDKIAKLYALYRFGVGGERETAEKMLISALAALGKTIADYEKSIDDQNEAIDYVYLRWKTEDEKRLTFQTVVMFFDGPPDGRVMEKSLEVRAGKSKCAVLKHTHRLLIDAWRRELDLFYSAFLHKNNIFAATWRSNNPNKDEMSAEDLMKMQQMARGIDFVQRHTAIEHK